MKFIKSYLNETIELVQKIDQSQIEGVINNIKIIKNQKGRIFFVGVGGGAGHASHAVNDFRKICGIEAYSPSENISELTARINDDGWETAYGNWLKGSRINNKDMIFVFSVGGGNIEKNISMNIVFSIKYAKQVGAKIVGIVGKDGGFTAKVADACVILPTINELNITPHTEGFQAVIWHMIVSHPELRENEMKWESVNQIK